MTIEASIFDMNIYIGQSHLSFIKQGTKAVAGVGSRGANDKVLQDKESAREGDPGPIERRRSS